MVFAEDFVSFLRGLVERAHEQMQIGRQGAHARDLVLFGAWAFVELLVVHDDQTLNRHPPTIGAKSLVALDAMVIQSRSNGCRKCPSTPLWKVSQYQTRMRFAPTQVRYLTY